MPCHTRRDITCRQKGKRACFRHGTRLQMQSSSGGDTLAEAPASTAGPAVLPNGPGLALHAGSFAPYINDRSYYNSLQSNPVCERVLHHTSATDSSAVCFVHRICTTTLIGMAAVASAKQGLPLQAPKPAAAATRRRCKRAASARALAATRTFEVSCIRVSEYRGAAMAGMRTHQQPDPACHRRSWRAVQQLWRQSSGAPRGLCTSWAEPLWVLRRCRW